MTHLLARKRALLPAFIAALAALAIGLQTAPARSTGNLAAAGKCRKGTVSARIGGKRRCLRAGQRCKKRFERQYRKHGFHCQAGRLRKVRKHPAPPPPPPPPPAPPPPDPPPPHLVGTGGLHSILDLPLRGSPDGADLGFGSYWVRVAPGFDLFRYDTASGRVTADIDGLPTAPSGFSQYVAAGEGAIWTSNVNAGSVTRIDPATNRVVTTIPVWPTNSCGPEPSTDCSAPTAIAFTPGAVWVVLHHEWKVVRIDPATNAVVATVSLGSGPPQGPQELTAANGFVYAGGSSGFGGPASLERIDPATNAATPVVVVANGCDAKAGTGTHVWVAAGVTGCGPGLPSSLLDVNTLTGTVVGSAALDNSAYAVEAGWGSVWALTDKLNRVDPANHTVTGTIQLAAGEAFMGADAQQLWLAVPNGVYQIGQ
jgi:hypothetical protein